MMRFEALHIADMADSFTSEYRAVVAGAAGVSMEAVNVLSVTPGSVLVDTLVTFPPYSSTQQSSSQHFTQRLSEEQPAGIFSGSFFSEYAGNITVENVVVSAARQWLSPPPPSPSPPPPPTESVTVLSQLISALENPEVDVIFISADIFLDGRALPAITRTMVIRGTCPNGASFHLPQENR